jgi:hypothetical protein
MDIEVLFDQSQVRYRLRAIFYWFYRPTMVLLKV